MRDFGHRQKSKETSGEGTDISVRDKKGPGPATYATKKTKEGPSKLELDDPFFRHPIMPYTELNDNFEVSPSKASS